MEGFSAIHRIYIMVIFSVILAMALKRDVMILCLLGAFIIGTVYNRSIIGGLQTVFNTFLIGGIKLFEVIVVIALMTAMLKSLQAIGVHILIIKPLRKLLSNPKTGFFILGVVMYLTSLFFWPTPATVMVGTLLLPAALQAGLSPIAAAISINILGHGMALSGDPVLQGAPRLSASAAGVPVESVLLKGLLLSLITGITAIIIAYFMNRKDIAKHEGIGAQKTHELSNYFDIPMKKSVLFLFVLGITAIFFIILCVMITGRIKGKDATSILGGSAVIVMVCSVIFHFNDRAPEKAAEFIKEGFLFAIKIFSPVIPIAGFFFMGSGESSLILGECAPKLLFDIGEILSRKIPLNKVALAFGNLIIGIITGLDGSGFSGLPLTGGIASALGGPAGVDVSVLAAIGQLGAVWSGGGTLTAWGFGLVVTAGITGVPPAELARRNFIPVVSGLTAATITGIFLM
ncbi:hypothetical protein H0A61_02761 [Koleobacter methoxysyntrophicus]|uniref:Uncharacterized protein n=1 Tax=Koleobacter methoxysyntrophicus TaxID=2751313 RepID=A0A8A0RT83_9FIRM|nr:hypothetical protein [Koleobacter methoxysyntrophicus]QSQ10356.1 hypothetical protein H0A61_02761 [Koleobacter methoxysyntrophicus]